MTADELETNIREGVARLDLKLRTSMGTYGNVQLGTCCAIGGALAYAAKNRQELQQLLGRIRDEVITDNVSWAHASARALNHGLTGFEMSNLEAGFEEWLSNGIENDPFYLLGRKLRKESLKGAR